MQSKGTSSVTPGYSDGDRKNFGPKKRKRPYTQFGQRPFCLLKRWKRAFHQVVSSFVDNQQNDRQATRTMMID
jgi:hypothetical protein